MKYIFDLSVTSRFWAADADWTTRYLAPGTDTAPALVLDFENDVYGTGGTTADFGDLVTLTRASSASAQAEDGATVQFAADEPVFDWSTGRRGLLLRRAQGARAKDIAYVDLGPWWSQDAATIVVQGTLLDASGNYDRIVEFHDGTSNSRISMLYNKPEGQMVFGVYENGAAQAVLLGGNTAYSPGASFKLAGSLATDDFAVAMDGLPALSDDSGDKPTGLLRLQLGAASSTGNLGSVLLTRIVVYPERLDNATLASLTN